MSQPAKQEFRKEKNEKRDQIWREYLDYRGADLEEKYRVEFNGFSPSCLSFFLSIEGKARERGGIERRILTGERLVFIEGG